MSLIYIGCVKHKVKIEMVDESNPLFYRPFSVPFRYRCRIWKEPATLEINWIIERLDHSDCVCPVTAVLKPYGKIRLCGNCALTINNIHEHNNVPDTNSRLLARKH